MASTLTKGALVALCYCAFAIGAPSVGQADIIIESPSAGYIASSTPEYFEGRPVYFFNNAWYFRDGNHWNYYRNEPQYLRGRRGRWIEGNHNHGRYRYHR